MHLVSRLVVAVRAGPLRHRGEERARVEQPVTPSQEHGERVFAALALGAYFRKRDQLDAVIAIANKAIDRRILSDPRETIDAGRGRGGAMAWGRGNDEESKKPRLNICHNGCNNGQITVMRRAIINGEETSLPENKDCPVCDGSGRIVDFG